MLYAVGDFVRFEALFCGFTRFEALFYEVLYGLRLHDVGP